VYVSDYKQPDAAKPQHPVVGVGVVVWKQDRVLLIRRGKPPMKGRWSLPGGRQELGETTRETAHREILEETGLTIQLGDLLDVIDTVRRDDAGTIQYHFTLVDFDADWQAGEALASSDAEAVTWADPATLESYDLWEETFRIIALSAKNRAAKNDR
jgi:8-oxo-dGTP diphosphatase